MKNKKQIKKHCKICAIIHEGEYDYCDKCISFRKINVKKYENK